MPGHSVKSTSMWMCKVKQLSSLCAFAFHGLPVFLDFCLFMWLWVTFKLKLCNVEFSFKSKKWCTEWLCLYSKIKALRLCIGEALFTQFIPMLFVSLYGAVAYILLSQINKVKRWKMKVMLNTPNKHITHKRQKRLLVTQLSLFIQEKRNILITIALI